MASLSSIHGLKQNEVKKLKSAGVADQDSLLQMGATRTGRTHIAKDAGVATEQVLEWVNRADLARVPGVNEEYANLLEDAGVDTVTELSHRKPDNLYKTLAEVNKKQKAVHRLPTESQVGTWISEASKLPKIVEY